MRKNKKKMKMGGKKYTIMRLRIFHLFVFSLNKKMKQHNIT